MSKLKLKSLFWCVASVAFVLIEIKCGLFCNKDRKYLMFNDYNAIPSKLYF